MSRRIEWSEPTARGIRLAAVDRPTALAVHAARNHPDAPHVLATGIGISGPGNCTDQRAPLHGWTIGAWSVEAARAADDAARHAL